MFKQFDVKLNVEPDNGIDFEEHFYYLRDTAGNPIITVCIFKDVDEMWYRGVAICSELDQPCKKTGRNIAMGRVRKAFQNSGNSEPIARDAAIVTFSWLGFSGIFDYKSEANVVLTDFEKELVKPPEEKETKVNRAGKLPDIVQQLKKLKTNCVTLTELVAIEKAINYLVFDKTNKESIYGRENK